jgi:hypothetical protein
MDVHVSKMKLLQIVVEIIQIIIENTFAVKKLKRNV